ncbi:GNAT family N-acetyltransferase [Bacillus niameyensis]|uniref:GNAT family N-acetyltransferase n=1 Tax=Bacillus niameyensis TaxID=1522308 RepID=UPI000786581C|nr:GNAT family N-acetyltransferase [Bacillus niameyensis]
MRIRETNDYVIIAKLNKGVHELHEKLYPEYFKPYNFEDMLEYFKEIVYFPDFIFLVLEEEEKPIGYAWIEIRNYMENALIKANQAIYVHQINIEEDHRNNGYGGHLMDAIIEMAKSKDIHRVELDYWFDNEVAKKFYEKLGFKKYREFVYKNLSGD